MAIQEKMIFVVDDDEMFSMMLSDHLSQNPLHKVVQFGTGEEAIKELVKKPDVIILDYNLNSIDPNAADGKAILQQIKSLDKQACVIMLSSQDQYGTALQTIVKGALEYVIKDKEAFTRIDTILASLA
jgi:two-component system OmpR family response regulator